LALPLLLAGPILRRVEPTLVCVWVALSESAEFKLTLWEGRVASGASNPHVASEPEHTQLVRVGDGLFVAVVALKLDKTSPKVLLPGRMYSYDLEVTVGTNTQNLKDLGLLRTGVLNGRRIEALGFGDFDLPHFSLPPAELTDLRVVFGSCRRPANAHADAMLYIDDLMAEGGALSHADPLTRPHQMFLGGDQIYADDVTPLHLSMLIDLGRELIGTIADGAMRERLPVDHLRLASVPAPAGFEHYGEDLPRGSAGTVAGDFLLPADAPHFPPARRFLLTTVEAQMTTVDGDSHLYSVGEFAAMYLSAWSNAVWPPLVSPEPAEGPALALPSIDEIVTTTWPSRIPTFVDAPLDGAETRDVGDDLSPFQNYEPQAARVPSGAFERSLTGQLKQLTAFELGLAKVRRVLANVPTYMIFDDHDVTDDWNLNPTWVDRVLGTSLGTATMRNGLVAYALFQDWGNDPLRYLKDEPKALVGHIGALFPPGNAPGPDAATADAIDTLLGLDRRGVMALDGSVGETRPPMKWHFSVPGPKHLAVALDNRTRRSFVSRNGPPGNVAIPAQLDQIPAGPFTDAKEVLLVIAPLQVIGPPLLDELVAPAAYRVFDMAAFTVGGKARPGLKDGSRTMAGTNPDAIEAWAFDAKTFEALLERLAPYRQVVLLSGDVHYTASDAMSYWKKNDTAPARIVQFTSSGLKNVMPSYITLVDRSLPFAQRLIRAEIGAERLGWTTRPSHPVVLAPGKTENDIARALRAKLRHEPTLVPTYGWPAGTTIDPSQPPDWQWRVEPLFDVRADAERPPAEQPLPIDAAAVAAQLDGPIAPLAIRGYQAIAASHQRALEIMRNSRQILFRSNVGVVRFEKRGGVLHAIHEAYSAFKLPSDVGTDPPKPAAFMIHAAALSTPDAPRPQARLQPLVKPT
jgi:hypothetical protein